MTQPLKTSLGANIAALRKARGLTQEQLAAQLGVSAPAVSKWETCSSCPDITLLCPLARALGASVDQLLAFEPTLSDREVVAEVNRVMETALAPDGGAAAAESQLQALLHRYPGCTALQFNAAAVYDSLTLFSAPLDETARTRYQQAKRALLEEVRRSGGAAYWQSATVQLASMAAAEGDTARAEALLDELPETAGDPTAVRVQLCLQKGQPEEALKLAQKTLYQSLVKVEGCMVNLMDARLLPAPDRARKACRAYRAVAKTFGLPDMSDGMLMEYCLQAGDLDGAAAAFARYVDVLTAPPAMPDPDLFSPGVDCTPAPQALQVVPAPWRQLLVQSLTGEEKYRPLFAKPAFAAALEKLKASV